MTARMSNDTLPVIFPSVPRGGKSHADGRTSGESWVQCVLRVWINERKIGLARGEFNLVLKPSSQSLRWPSSCMQVSAQTNCIIYSPFRYKKIIIRCDFHKRNFSNLAVSRNSETDYEGILSQDFLICSLCTSDPPKRPERLFPQLYLIFKGSSLLLLSLMTPNVPVMYSSVCLLWLLWNSPTPSAKFYTLKSSRDPPWLSFRIEFHLLCLLLPLLSDLLIGPAQLLLCGADNLQRNCLGGFAPINILPRDIFHFQWAWL